MVWLLYSTRTMDSFQLVRTMRNSSVNSAANSRALDGLNRAVSKEEAKKWDTAVRDPQIRYMAFSKRFTSAVWTSGTNILIQRSNTSLLLRKCWGVSCSWLPTNAEETNIWGMLIWAKVWTIRSTLRSRVWRSTQLGTYSMRLLPLPRTKQTEVNLPNSSKNHKRQYVSRPNLRLQTVLSKERSQKHQNLL